MFYIPKIDDDLKILTDEEIIINNEFFESIREERNLRKVAQSL